MHISRRSFVKTLAILPILHSCGSGRTITQVTITKTPDSAFDLSGWKLQIPGPKEIKDLRTYTSKYFYLNAQNQLCFTVDCAETGSTPNSSFVRSELRHLAQWNVLDSSAKTLSATLNVASAADPDKVTVMQIHGITADGGPIPPLLRIALNRGALYAFIKKNSAGNETASTLLAADVGARQFTCAITVQSGRIAIAVNGTQLMSQDVSFWPYGNYFKTGCYPQAQRGIVTVALSELMVQGLS